MPAAGPTSSTGRRRPGEPIGRPSGGGRQLTVSVNASVLARRLSGLLPLLLLTAAQVDGGNRGRYGCPRMERIEGDAIGSPPLMGRTLRLLDSWEKDLIDCRRLRFA